QKSPLDEYSVVGRAFQARHTPALHRLRQGYGGPPKPSAKVERPLDNAAMGSRRPDSSGAPVERSVRATVDGRSSVSVARCERPTEHARFSVWPETNRSTIDSCAHGSSLARR